MDGIIRRPAIGRPRVGPALARGRFESMTMNANDSSASKEGTARPQAGRKVALGVFALAMINVSAILSLKNLPMMSEYGSALVFYICMAGLIFFIPTALVSAELATGWPPKGAGPGGVYVWVKEGFGKRAGFLAVWLQWVEDVVWFPTILSFSAATMAYIFNPAFANNKLYNFLFILTMLWGATLLNFRGMRASSMISSLGAIAGTIVPGALIIGLGALWLIQGNPSQISFDLHSLVPNFHNMQGLVLLAGIFLSFTGMEMSAVHVNAVNNPQKDFPKAILLSVTIILALCIAGSLAIAIVVPHSEINLVAGVMEAFDYFFKAHHLEFLTPIMAFLISFSGIAMLSTWLVGPTKGLLVTARDGSLPPSLRKINRHHMPVTLLIIQAAIVTLFSSVFLIMPSVQSSFWILTVLTSQVYLIMYILMFISGIRLRYSRPDVKRAYRIPFKNIGMWIVAGTGLVGSVFCMWTGFIPPAQLKTGHDILFYELFLVIGIVILAAPPLVIYHFKRPGWEASEEEAMELDE